MIGIETAEKMLREAEVAFQKATDVLATRRRALGTAETRHQQALYAKTMAGALVHTRQQECQALRRGAR